MAWWGWAQILRFAQDDTRLAQDDIVRAIANYFFEFDKMYKTLPF